jgi:hypothetical protein
LIDKNALLVEELRNKRPFIKNSSPLEPQYVLSTKSNRRMLYGEIPESHPKE